MTRRLLLLLLLALAAPMAPVAADDLCAPARATVAISDVTMAGEDGIQSKGTWQVEGGAAGVLLEYRIDSDRLQSEAQAGAAGAWDIAQEPLKCGRHTLRVYAFPYVLQGSREIHCLKQASSTPQPFEISCAPIVEIADCQWECAGERCTGTCTATARRGRLAYQPHWGIAGAKPPAPEPTPEPSTEGPWTQAVACAPGEKVTFKVRDRDGRGLWSNVAERACGK